MSAAPADRIAALRAPVALALSGGGARGAAQAGVLAELVSAGLRPDLVVGTSIGAWNGAWLAAHPEADGVEALRGWWADGDVRQVFRGLWLGYAGALAWRRSAALSAERVERLLDRALGGRRFEDLRLPLAVGATDLLSTELCYLDRGPLATAIRASSAIPTVLPPVPVDDRLFVDGGVVDNFGVNEAVRRGARSIVLIDASTFEVRRPPVGIGEIVDRSTLVAQVHQRRRSLAAAAGAGVPLHLIEVGSAGSALDFARAEEAFGLGQQVGRAWLSGEVLPPAHTPLPEEDRRLLVGAWHTLEERVRSRVVALPLWRRAGLGAPALDSEGREIGVEAVAP